jgi:aminobenzoyl-glutamate transport protein
VKDVGIGTIISMMLPYTIAYMIVRIPMFIIWIWLRLPLGIEGPIFYGQ